MEILSLMEKFLNKSNSYVFYKSKYNQLKKENKKLKTNLKRANSSKNRFQNKMIQTQKELSKYRKPQILEKIINENYEELTVAIKSPNPLADRKWGDYFFAHALKKSFEKKGFHVIVQEREHWYDDVDVDINIVLRGLRDYDINYDEINVMWNISHPDLVTYDEYDKYDIVFIASERYANILKTKLNTQVETLFQCTDPDVFYTEKHENLSENILFVGVTRGIYREIVKDCLEKNHDLSIFGVGWDEFIDKELIKGEFIPNDELYKYYSSCKILLNDHWQDMKDLDFPSNRLFDALACGTFVISDDIPSAKTLFDGNIITYSDADDLDEKIKFYLDNPQEREKLSKKGKEIVLKNHTFDNRVDEILNCLKSLNERYDDN